jgi:hypothetical protein
VPGGGGVVRVPAVLSFGGCGLVCVCVCVVDATVLVL